MSTLHDESSVDSTFDQPLRFGQAPKPFYAPSAVDCPPPMYPRRPEAGTYPASVAKDLAVWGEWLRQTFKLGRWLPPCWGQHPALAEEVLALWFAWSAAFAGDEPFGPINWLGQLDASLHRMDRWSPGCTPYEHKVHHPEAPTLAFDEVAVAGEWWSNADFDGEW